MSFVNVQKPLSLKQQIWLREMICVYTWCQQHQTVKSIQILFQKQYSFMPKTKTRKNSYKYNILSPSLLNTWTSFQLTYHQPTPIPTPNHSFPATNTNRVHTSLDKQILMTTPRLFIDQTESFQNFLSDQNCSTQVIDL